jgi:hypothetical protein
MLKIKCDKCHSELQEPGALMFSPPTTESWVVEKYHLCAKCWAELAALLKCKKPENANRHTGAC